MRAIKVKINNMTLKSRARACVPYRRDYCYRKKNRKKCVCTYYYYRTGSTFNMVIDKKTKRNNRLPVSRSLTRESTNLRLRTRTTAWVFVRRSLGLNFLNKSRCLRFYASKQIIFICSEYVYRYKRIKHNIVFPGSKSSIPFRFIMFINLASGGSM